MTRKKNDFFFFFLLFNNINFYHPLLVYIVVMVACECTNIFERPNEISQDVVVWLHGFNCSMLSYMGCQDGLDYYEVCSQLLRERLRPKISPCQPHKNMGIIVAINEEEEE